MKYAVFGYLFTAARVDTCNLRKPVEGPCGLVYEASSSGSDPPEIYHPSI